MKNLISIYDLSQISDFLPQISPAMYLLNVFMQMCDDVNAIKVGKLELASALNRSRRTVSEWIRMLCKSGAIKYKYSGLVRLNPFLYYKGTAENYKKAKEEWAQFKSDIKAI